MSTGTRKGGADHDPRRGHSEEDEDVSLWLDRFASSTTASDAEAALDGLLGACKVATSSRKLRADDWPSVPVDSLVRVMQGGSSSDGDGKDIFLDDSGCQLLALQVVSEVIFHTQEDWAAKLFLEHSVVSALVDVSCSASLTTSLLSRVLALETLDALARRRSTAKQTQTQLLQANGLVRLADVFTSSVGEGGAASGGPVALAMLQLAQTIVEWPAVARNWMFVDVPTALLSTFVRRDEDETAVSANNGPRVQALRVLTRMVQQDASFATLLLETTPNLHVLLPCLDLRLAAQYREPSLIAVTKGSRASGTSKTESTTQANMQHEEEDDLDALLRSGSAAKPTSVASSPSSSPGKQAATATVEIPPPPTLLDSEIEVIDSVMEFLAVLLEQESVRSSMWRKHEPVGRMLWDMALLTPPPPPTASSSPVVSNRYYPCAMAPVELQSRALAHCAGYWNNPSWLLPCLDRLLYLACTGAGALVASSAPSQRLRDRFQITQGAVHLLRQTLSLEMAQELLVSAKIGMHDPGEGRMRGDNDGDAASSGTTAAPSSVRKLVYTVLEHSEIVRPPRGSDGDAVAFADEDTDSQAVFLVGATTALLVVLHDNEASKSMLLNLEPNLLPRLVAMLDVAAATAEGCGSNCVLLMEIVLHFLVRWVDGAPVVLQALLQLPEASTVMAQLSSSSARAGQALVWVLLGLSLDEIASSHFSPSDPAADGSTRDAVAAAPNDAVSQQDWGGWTASAIVDTFKTRGISRAIQDLKQYESSLSWLENCEAEQKIHRKWYKEVELRIRKRLIQAVLQQNTSYTDQGPRESEVEEESGSAAWSSLRSSSRSLSILVEQQTSELEELRTQLSDARRTLSKQEQQLQAWKRRVESTPTQLDDMLNEYTAKTSDLVAQVSDLTEKLEVSHRLRQQDKDTRDEELTQVRKELQEAREKAAESQREREDMAVELKALSQAYSNLEEEYRRQSEFTSSAEDASATLQSQGEGSEEHNPREGLAGSTEVAALRADNARLKQDVKAAEDWMAMAYERMNTMQQENLSLQTQLENVHLIGMAAQANKDTAGRVLADERNRRQQLEKELLERQQRESELSNDRDVERALRMELEVALNSSAEQLERARELQAELESTVESLKRDIEAARSTDCLPNGASSEDELKSLQCELDKIKERDQDDIYKLEAKVRELEARLSGGLGEYTVDDIRKRDDDIQQLQDANAAAQAWMSRAMEQNQGLAKQVAALTEDKAALTERINELESMLSDTNVADLKIALINAEKLLADQAEDAKTVIAGWQQAYNLAEANRNELETQLSAIRSVPDTTAVVLELEQTIETLKLQLQNKSVQFVSSESPAEFELQSTINSLRRQLEEQEQEARAAIEGWQQSYIEIESRLKDVRSVHQDSQVDEQMARVEKLTTEVEALHRQLQEKETDAAANAAKVSELQEALSTLQRKCDSVDVERERHQMVETQSQEMSLKISELESTVSSLQEQLRSRDTEAQQAAEKTSNLERVAASLREELEAQEREATEAITGWQQSYDQVSQECRRLQEGLVSAAELESIVRNLKEQLDISVNRVTELEATNANLQQKLENQDCEANEALIRLQRSYDEVLARSKELEEDLALVGESDKASRAELVKSVLNLKEQLESRNSEGNRLSELQNVVTKLQQELSTQERKASETITGWKSSYDEVLGNYRELEKKVALQEAIASTGESDQATRAKLESLVSDLREQLESRNIDGNRVTELEAVISNLQESIRTQEHEANEVITGWQRSYDEILERCKGLEEELGRVGRSHDASREELENAVSNLKEQLEGQTIDGSRVNELESIVAHLQKELETREREANEAISGWQQSYNDVLERCQGLEGTRAGETNNMEITVSDLKRQLDEKEREANEKITDWQNRYNELVERSRDQADKLTSQQQAFEVELSSRHQTEADIVDLRQQLEDQLRQTSEATSKVTELEVVAADLRRDLDSQAREAHDAILVWQHKCSEGETFKLELDQQVATLKAEVESLGERLQQQEQEATSAIEQWEESYRRLESELNKQKLPMDAQEELLNLQDELEKLKLDASLLRESNSVLLAEKSQLQICGESLSEQMSSLRSEVGVLRLRLAQQQEEATSAISQWEESYQTLESDFSELKQVQEELMALQEKLKSVERDGAILREENVSLREANSQLEIQLESWNKEKDKARDFGLSDAMLTLQAEVETLKVCLQEQEEGAANTITRLEENCELLESKLSAIKVQSLPSDVVSELAELKDELKSVESDTDLLRNNNASLLATKSQLESQVESLKDQLLTSQIAAKDRDSVEDQLRERVDMQDSEISKLTIRCSVLQSEKDELEAKLQATKDEKANVVGSLEETISSLRFELAEHDEQANEAINQWQESLSDAEARFESLQSEKYDIEGRIRDLENTVANLSKELSEHDELANEAINQWQESLSEAEVRIQALESEKSELERRIESMEASLAASATELQNRRASNDATDTLRSRCRQLEDELAFLEDQAETYEATIAERDTELVELQRRVEVSDDQVAAVREENDRLLTEVQEIETRLTATKAEAEVLAVRLKEAEREHESAVRELKGQMEILTAEMHDLTGELKSQELDAQAAIAQWESSYMELQEQLDRAPHAHDDDVILSTLQNEIYFKEELLLLLVRGSGNADASRRLTTSGPSTINEVKQKLLELNDQLESKAISLRNRLSEAQTGVASVDDVSRIQKLEEQVDALLRESTAHEQEREKLQGLIHELEEDVRAAEDMLRLHMSNETSDRAVNLVIETLQKENDALRSQIEADQTTLGAEQDARRAAESEAKILAADLAAVFEMHDSVDHRPEVRLRAMHAREALHLREEEEIEQMKDALTAALNELVVVRRAVFDAEERASKAGIQASLYEQDIVTAKMDLKLLAEKMDDMRDAESSKREALEHRICTLENECSGLRRQHAVALDKVQNELNQAVAEKDRLLQALKDSERSKDALLRASAGDRDLDGNDLFVELTRLRLEKAELLNSGAEEATKMERRLREARAAKTGSNDAEVILERELRVAAETALEALKREITELRIRSDLNHSHELSLGDLKERMSATELRDEVRRLQGELRVVSDENVQLRDQLERLEQEGQEQVDALREECRHAKSRAAYLEREGRVEAEVQVEVARLRARSSFIGGGRGADSPRTPRRHRPSPLDPAYEDGLDDDAYESDREVKREQDGLTMKQMSAMIREQDRRIKEGNAAYSTLLSEHDELLALLAKVHNIRTSLKRALIQAAGPSAVEEAFRAAERMTQSQREGVGVGRAADAGINAGGSPGTSNS